MNKTIQYKMNSVFFSKDGISSSQAETVANLAKERVVAHTAKLNRFKPFKQSIVINGQRRMLVESERCDSKDILFNGETYSLSAWLRSAIKAKNELIDYVKLTNFSDFMEDGEHIHTELSPEVKAKPFTEEDALNELSANDRCTYLSLESKAAHLGQAIHDKGFFTNIRNAILAGPSFAVKVLKTDKGEVDFPIDFEPVISTQEVDDEFFQLQKQHREFESSLNHFKARIKNRVNEENAKRSAENSLIIKKRLQESQRLASENAALELTCESRRAKLLREVSSYKILIPDDLKSAYDAISNLGK